MLRFAAAMFVVLFHYNDESPVELWRIHPLFDRGYLATNFFLLLSGYVLGRAYGQAIESGRTGPAEFLARRAARIWPAHVVVLAAMVMLVAAAGLAGVTASHPERFSWPDIAPQLLLIQSWGQVGGWGWNLPTWSLSALLFCYAVFPLLWRAVRALPLWATVILGLGVATVFHLVVALLIGRALFDLPYYLGVYRALPFFLGGVILARWTMEAPAPRLWAGRAAGLAAIALLLVQLFWGNDTVSLLLIASAVYFLGSMPVERPIPGAEMLGKLSFSLFITHVLTATVWFGLLHLIPDSMFPTAVDWALWGLSLPVALAAAWVFDRVIDQPLQRRVGPLLKQAFRPRPDRYPAPAPNG